MSPNDVTIFPTSQSPKSFLKARHNRDKFDQDPTSGSGFTASKSLLLF